MHVGRGIADVLRHCLAQVVEHVAQNDLGAFARQQARLGLALATCGSRDDRLANAGGPARDDRDLAIEPTHDHPPRASPPGESTGAYAVSVIVGIGVTWPVRSTGPR